jgi:hypothetical protein
MRVGVTPRLYRDRSHATQSGVTLSALSDATFSNITVYISHVHHMM